MRQVGASSHLPCWSPLRVGKRPAGSEFNFPYAAQNTSNRAQPGSSASPRLPQDGFVPEKLISITHIKRSLLLSQDVLICSGTRQSPAWLGANASGVTFSNEFTEQSRFFFLEVKQKAQVQIELV